MGFDSISLESGIRANLLAVKSTDKLLVRTQERLATGKDVNSIKDNPTNFFAARSLNDRASQLNSRLDGMGQAVQTINAANAGIDAIRDLIANMKAVVNDALAKSDSGERRDLGEQYNTLIDQAALLAQDSGYAGVNLLTKTQTLQVQFSETNGASTLNVAGLNVSGRTNGVSSVTGISSITQASKASFGSIASNGSQASLASRSSSASQGSTGSIASQSSQASIASQAAVASQGSIGGPGSQASFGSVASVASQASRSSNASAASVGSVSSAAAVASQASIASRTSMASAGSLGAISVTISQSYAFTLDFGADSRGTDEVVGIRSHYQYDNGTVGSHGVDFGSGRYLSELNNLTTELDSFDTALKTEAARMATSLNIITVREEFTDTMISTLNEGADKLTLGDMNEEGANLLALQTRHSLGIQSLALSSQNSQQVLRLLS